MDPVGEVEHGEAIRRAITVAPGEGEERVAGGRITGGFSVAAYRARPAGAFGAPGGGP
ncbi:hypothetical protein ABZ299_04720 [Streptomyces sp. NPDC006184]|uniref:hypothetical protein n=1 Tax=Streptomyces sp. NPDC006184 TaxID=3155455 RepID=UPI0033A1757E